MISFRTSEELAHTIEVEAERLKISQSDLVRKAVEQYFQTPTEKRQDNMHVVLSKFAESVYENAKTRALVLEMAHKLGIVITETDLEEIELDAREYVKERRGD